MSQLIMKIELLIIAVGLVMGVCQYFNNFPSVKNAIALATTMQPEMFTELYFENHNSLPHSIIEGKEYSFVFTAHNVEHKDINYSYLVYLQSDSQKILLDKGIFFLKHNEFRSIKENLKVSKNLRTKIVVEILNKNQQISFWMEKQ